jgi:20S proteasome subunit beta 2
MDASNTGFDFSNHARNQFLGERLGSALPKGTPLPSLVPVREFLRDVRTATSTGTTIVGVKFGGGNTGEPEGVCLGADTRATGGPIVADKNCEKVRFSCNEGKTRGRLSALRLLQSAPVRETT